jgi:glyoxylase-like metal-dependent hydrolase (beta-lactamase superfamily II)
VAHENTRANLARATCAPVGGCSWFKGEDAKYLPKKTFKDKMSLKSGDLTMELYWFGRAHTNGDIAIVFPSMRLAHVGDLFAWRGVPRVMPDDGGSTHDFPDTLKKAQAAIKNVDTIITGHSAVQTWQDWVDYYEFQRTFVDQIKTANKAGKTVDEAIAGLRFPEKFKVCPPSNTFVSQRMPFDPNGTCIWRTDQAKSDAQNLYDELKRP